MEQWFRDHSQDIGCASIAQEEVLNEDDTVTFEPAYITAYISDRKHLTASEARKLAAELIGAADQLEAMPSAN